jgi:hypothetical protein
VCITPQTPPGVGTPQGAVEAPGHPNASGQEADRPDGLRPIPTIRAGEGVTLQVIGPEPDDPCSHCGRREPQVYLIRNPSQGVESVPLHEGCAVEWFKKEST